MDQLLKELKEKALQEGGYSALSEASGLSRQNLYKIFSGKSSPRIDIVARIAETLNCKLKSERALSTEDLIDQLALIGAPVSSNKIPKQQHSRLSVLLAAIATGRTNPLIHSVLPFTLWKNRTVIDWEFLAENSQKKYLGYLLETVQEIRPSAEIDRALSFVAQAGHQPDEPLEPLFISSEPMSKYAKLKLTRLKNPLAEKWGFLTSDAQATFAERFNKWAKDLRGAF